MKYMLMIIGPEDWYVGLSEAQLRDGIAARMAFHQALESSGAWAGGQKLREAAEAVTIRRDRGRLVCVEGPFVETKELFGGFYQVEADSPEAAEDWAVQLPVVDGTYVEVRPCRTGAEGSVPVHGKHKYMVMFLQDRDRRLTRDEIFASIDRHYELSLELAVQGKFVASRSLAPPDEAVTLQRQEGRSVRVDGPYAETKEVLLGYFVIACDTRDEAVEWAKQLMAGADACEVRPIHEL